jgi:hypothetical protein
VSFAGNFSEAQGSCADSTKFFEPPSTRNSLEDRSMDPGARWLLIGLFGFVVAAAAFVFVYRVGNTGGLGGALPYPARDARRRGLLSPAFWVQDRRSR